MSEALRYPAQVFFSEEDEGYIAVAPDLPGCSAFGETAEEALRELQNAIHAWIGAAKKAGNPVPPPSPRSQEELPSGKVLLRLPKTLHAQLIDRASRDGSSLNTCVVMLLSQALAGRNQEFERLESASPGTVSVTNRPLGLQYLTLTNVDLTTAWDTVISDALDTYTSGEFSHHGRRTVQRAGSVMNIRTLPANKPVIYVDDDNG